VLALWGLGIGQESALFAGLPPMVPNTALLCLLGGISLFLQAPLRSGLRVRTVSRALAAAACVFAGSGLCAHVFGTPALPFDRLSSFPTAATFALLGVALIFFDGHTPKGRRPAAGLALAAGSMVVVSALGHLFRVGLLYGESGLRPGIGMSVPTMTAILALTVGVLLARPETGFMATVTSADIGGATVRRLLLGMAGLVPAAVLIALAERLEWFDAPLAASLLLFVGVAEGIAFILATGSRLNRAAEAQRRVEQRARELLEHASEGIFVADLEGRYTEVNPAGCRMLGYSREQLIGRTIMDLLPAEEVPRLARVKEELLGQGVHVGEWSLRRADQSFLPVEVSAKILPDGRWQGFVRDISERRGAEEALRRLRERERFRLALEAAASATVVVGRDGRISFVNGEAERMFGWTREELTGRFVEVLVPDRFRSLHGSYRDAFFQESIGKRAMGVGRDLYALRKNGAEFPVEIALSRFEEAGQEFVVASIADLTVRREAERALRESEERFRLLVQGTRDYAIFMHDPEGRITVWNEGAERILGYRAEEILDERFIRFYPPEEIARGSPDSDLRTAVDKGSLEVEGWRVRKDGSRFWAGVLITPLFGPGREILGFGKVVRDLTERRKQEEQLKASEARLRQTVLELESYAYTISHDLRSPLRAIQGYAHFLSERLADQADAESHRMLQRMGQAAVRLDHLIRDLLSYSAIAQTDVEFQVVELDEILDHVAGHYPALTKVSLRVRAPLSRVRGQPSLLIQVLSNLLDNAVKFVPTDRSPEVDIWTERREGGRILLFIQDNGIGIPREAWEGVFKPFTRLHPEGEYKGTGIGLAIVRKAVERLGGSIRLQSQPGKGSRFEIELQEA